MDGLIDLIAIVCLMIQRVIIMVFFINDARVAWMGMNRRPHATKCNAVFISIDLDRTPSSSSVVALGSGSVSSSIEYRTPINPRPHD